MTAIAPLAALQVWEALEVGPVQLYPNKLVMPYRVRTASGVEASALTYKWPEPVFDPGSEADRNLASLIGAQLALNYGLFCEELVFHGPFSAADRRFLDEMARNTSREIYVLKLRRPNPFLRGLDVPRVVADDVQLAPVRFSDPVYEGPVDTSWGGEGRTAALSSGGKDSLLTLGILREIGEEAHPIFVNESGRHWFTALNSWRALQGSDPLAARVWCDCDRLFSWFLRRLPFIRPDFASVRADIYPIRLYTVAVFLFGAVPLLRARGIGRIAIGDEYDTSERGVQDGVPHFNGLFDQSRWFDERVSALFAQRGSALEVFSLLRPCSELLIQRALARRYPELQRTQVSCHATTVVEGRARPCGKCEKCRRIVAMLLAFDGDPAGCGYGSEARERALAALSGGSLSQEEAGAREVARRLVERGLVAADSPFGRTAEAHPEVFQLRFDPERSPRDAVPAALRWRVWQVLLEEAEGAVQWRDGAWVPLELSAAAASGPAVEAR